MKEIEKAFNELWDSTFNDDADVCQAIRMTEELVKETIQILRKENFALSYTKHFMELSTRRILMKEIEEDLIMKEIMEAFEKVWSCADCNRDDAIAEAQLLVMDTIDILRKENFELYKALHGVKHPEDIDERN